MPHRHTQLRGGAPPTPPPPRLAASTGKQGWSDLRLPCTLPTRQALQWGAQPTHEPATHATSPACMRRPPLRVWRRRGAPVSAPAAGGQHTRELARHRQTQTGYVTDTDRRAYVRRLPPFHSPSTPPPPSTPRLRGAPGKLASRRRCRQAQQAAIAPPALASPFIASSTTRLQAQTALASPGKLAGERSAFACTPALACCSSRSPRHQPELICIAGGERPRTSCCRRPRSRRRSAATRLPPARPSSTSAGNGLDSVNP